MQCTKWILRYWVDDAGQRSVERWLDRLSKEQLRPVTKELRMLETCGCELKLPHSRALGNGLFELRERTYGYRIYYGFCEGKLIILLHAGSKSRQQNDIKIARMRLLTMQKS